MFYQQYHDNTRGNNFKLEIQGSKHLISVKIHSVLKYLIFVKTFLIIK